MDLHQCFIFILTVEHGCPQFAIFAQRGTYIFNERSDLREGEMILEFVQLGLGKDSVNRIEDVAFEARGTGHGWDGCVRGFLDNVIEHLLVLG